jgi:hypothetical protein
MNDYKVRAGEIEEDKVTSWVESYSAQLPSSCYLIAAAASIVASLTANLQHKKHNALFFGTVGSAVPTTRYLQQDGEATRVRRSQQKGRLSAMGPVSFSFEA